MKKIAILGMGTVGQGLYEILMERKEKIEEVIQDTFEISAVLVSNLEKERNLAPTVKITNDFTEILEDEEIDIVVELTGALEQGYDYIKSSLEKGKDVVTANKSVISKYYDSLHEIAAKEGRSLLYEASVGGGIPIIKPLKEEILINDIESIQGILNGTCNYILSRLFQEKISYGEILKDAQRLGYAEADPTADVEGLDSMRKLRILSSIAYHTSIDEEEIETYGISTIIKEDVDYIEHMDSTLKLLGMSKLTEEGYVASVEPTIVDKSDYFATVDMAFNSISFVGHNIGPLKFYGYGAGKLPTGDAVARDVIDILLTHATVNLNHDKKEFKNLNESAKGQYYLRISNNTNTFRKISDKFQPIEFKEKNDIAYFVFKNVNRDEIIEYVDKLGIYPRDFFLAKVGY